MTKGLPVMTMAATRHEGKLDCPGWRNRHEQAQVILPIHRILFWTFWTQTFVCSFSTIPLIFRFYSRNGPHKANKN